MRSTTRLEIAANLILLAIFGVSGLTLFQYFRPAPLVVNNYEVVPGEAYPGDEVLVVSEGVKTYACPVTARWFLEDATGRLFSWSPPVGFNDPTGKRRGWTRTLVLPSNVAPGLARQWEEIEYDCAPFPKVVYAPPPPGAPLMILERPDQP